MGVFSVIYGVAFKDSIFSGFNKKIRSDCEVKKKCSSTVYQPDIRPHVWAASAASFCICIKKDPLIY